MKEEALQLAKYLDRLNGYMDMPRDILDITQPSSAMIRRLVEELDKLNGCLIAEQEHNEMLQTKPLSDEEIHDIWKSLWEGGNIGHIAYNYARAIEERHGIKSAEVLK